MSTKEIKTNKNAGKEHAKRRVEIFSSHYFQLMMLFLRLDYRNKYSNIAESREFYCAGPARIDCHRVYGGTGSINWVRFHFYRFLVNDVNAMQIK